MQFGTRSFNPKIAAFLVQQGAKSSVETWEQFCESARWESPCVSSVEAILEVGRCLSKVCDFIDSIFVLDAQIHEALLELVSPRSNCAPEFVLFADDDFIWSTAWSVHRIYSRTRPSKSNKQFLAADAASFERLLRRAYLKSSPPWSGESTGPISILKCIIMIEPILHNPNNFVRMKEFLQREDLNHCVGASDFLQSRINCLIRFGIDPCDSREDPIPCTPTLLMVVLSEEPLDCLLTVWFDALAKAGIAIDLVARHTFLTCSEEITEVINNGGTTTTGVSIRIRAI